MSNLTDAQNDGPETTAPEDESDSDAYIGEPLDGDYLAHLNEEASS